MKQLLLNSVFKFHYTNSQLKLNGWPSNSVKMMGTSGILQQPKLYYCISTTVNKSLEPVSALAGENDAKGPTIASKVATQNKKKRSRGLSDTSFITKKSKIKLV